MPVYKAYNLLSHEGLYCYLYIRNYAASPKGIILVSMRSSEAEPYLFQSRCLKNRESVMIKRESVMSLFVLCARFHCIFRQKTCFKKLPVFYNLSSFFLNFQFSKFSFFILTSFLLYLNLQFYFLCQFLC